MPPLLRRLAVPLDPDLSGVPFPPQDIRGHLMCGAASFSPWEGWSCDPAAGQGAR